MRAGRHLPTSSNVGSRLAQPSAHGTTKARLLDLRCSCMCALSVNICFASSVNAPSLVFKLRCLLSWKTSTVSKSWGLPLAWTISLNIGK